MSFNYTTAVSAYCAGGQVGYSVYFSNKTVFTYILGVNASNIPPGIVSLPAVAYVPIISLMVAVILFIVLFARRNSLTWRVVAIALAIITMVATRALASPYVTTTLNCLTSSGSYDIATVSIPNPYYPYAITAYIALFSVIMVAVVLQLYDYLMGEIT
jgi:glucan phosphoethanolaminetransferase (alkaline phosphatase superfamily)